MTDPIADMLSRIRNAIHARHKKVDVPTSQLKVGIADILKKGGYLRTYRLYRQEGKGILRLYLKYVRRGQSVIHGLKRISKPGRRVYMAKKDLSKVYGGLGIAILSTSKGLMTESGALENKVGGEYLCMVW